MSFTDQKPHLVTEADLHAAWSGGKDGKYFRCYLCGHKFVLNDVYRWVQCTNLGYGNLMVCSSCDCPDVVQKWIDLHKEWEKLREGRFWHFIIPKEDNYKYELREADHEIRDLRDDLKSINQRSGSRY